jgi:hypothetical protein
MKCPEKPRNLLEISLDPTAYLLENPKDARRKKVADFAEAHLMGNYIIHPDDCLEFTSFVSFGKDRITHAQILLGELVRQVYETEFPLAFGLRLRGVNNWLKHFLFLLSGTELVIPLHYEGSGHTDNLVYKSGRLSYQRCRLAPTII